ncbi:ribonuclease domain-containing protein [Deinococcus sp.]|uniref:ribonuclease domain-containing protein n=1 Tax=Deinococcus sp. TaxID=47478 RepID=UPI003C7CA234
MTTLRPILLLLCVALTACHSPGQLQTSETQTQTAQPQQTAPRQSASPRQTGTDPTSGLRWIAVSDLPIQGQQTYRLILAGGPFPYARDGVVFQNREGLLPKRGQGTYHEYTVRTPGSSDRGARRIICATVPECYYTADHYASFQRIRP